MSYPACFLELQVLFARRLAELSGRPLPQMVLRHTALYRILGLDWSLDPSHPVWQRFVDALGHDGSGFEAAYSVYEERYRQGLIPDHEPSRPHWGCFSYEEQPGDRSVRLHFSNWDTTGMGPLSTLRQSSRLAELQAMFGHISHQHPDVALVRGGSWLYNREEYLRLFPPSYHQSARVDHPHLIARGLWGQFLRHGNRLNEQVAACFADRVAALSAAAEYAGCFPYRVLLTEAPIADFYAFYGIAVSG